MERGTSAQNALLLPFVYYCPVSIIIYCIYFVCIAFSRLLAMVSLCREFVATYVQHACSSLG